MLFTLCIAAVFIAQDTSPTTTLHDAIAARTTARSVQPKTGLFILTCTFLFGDGRETTARGGTKEDRLVVSVFSSFLDPRAHPQSVRRLKLCGEFRRFC